ncbi:hypothetical protein BGZ81_003893, partial [Podila clonocystis]
MPKWLWTLTLSKRAGQRPQVSFLPQVEDNGTARVRYQASLYKTLAIIKKRAAEVSTNKD